MGDVLPYTYTCIELMGIRERSPETWSQQKGDDEDERAVPFSSCFLVLVFLFFFFHPFGYV